MTNVTTGAEEWLAASGANAPLDASAKQIELPYVPFAKQQQFHASSAKYRLFGGAAGPGKTKALLMEAILQAHEHPGANTLLLRRRFPELEQSLLLYFRRDVPRELYKTFHESKHVVEWHNGSTTRFGYCQSESDVYQYQGAEFLFIGIDELTMFTLRQWQFLTSRNRCPVPGAFPCMAGATNPGNIGHAWVKSLWIDRKAAPGMENPEAYDSADYDFIPARVSDNPIYAADEQYLKTLRALPSHLRRAFLDGEWDVFAGQYFDHFSPARHVVRAEDIRGPQVPGEGSLGDQWKPWWPRWISIDWGFEHPAAVYWHATVPGAAPKRDPSVAMLPRDDNAGRVVTYREYVTRRMAPRELAAEIVRRSLPSEQQQQIPRRPQSGLAPFLSQGRRDDSAVGESERIDAIYLSPDAFARRTDEQSIADQMGDVFFAAGMPRPVPADDDRVGGWMLMYQMLDAGEWLLTDNCIELIRTLPNLIRDPARVEDVEKMDGDDPADAARYGLKSRYAARHGDPDGWRSRMPRADRLAAHGYSADPTIQAMQARKFLIEESRGRGPISFLHRRR